MAFVIGEQTSGIKALLLKFEHLGRRESMRRPVSGSILGDEDVIPRNEVLNETKVMSHLSCEIYPIQPYLYQFAS